MILEVSLVSSADLVLADLCSLTTKTRFGGEIKIS